MLRVNKVLFIVIKDTSIPFKDVRLTSGTAVNISHIRDIHNAKDDGKKDKDVTVSNFYSVNYSQPFYYRKF